VTGTATPSQTVGPFFSIGLAALYRDQLAALGVAGERITIQGRVIDGGGKPVPDAVLEIWQADAEGNHPPTGSAEGDAAEPSCFGFGRIPTDETGSFRFYTIKPGSVAAPDGTMQAPHLVVSVFMRGLLLRLITRIYFSGEPLNEKDYVLNLVAPGRKGTLMANPIAGALDILEWNIVLQGENETVFFDC
jgi:protocatechuate 3,4-dioxygenase, alpha subunit